MFIIYGSHPGHHIIAVCILTSLTSTYKDKYRGITLFFTWSEYTNKFENMYVYCSDFSVTCQKSVNIIRYAYIYITDRRIICKISDDFVTHAGNVSNLNLLDITTIRSIFYMPLWIFNLLSPLKQIGNLWMNTCHAGYEKKITFWQVSRDDEVFGYKISIWSIYGGRRKKNMTFSTCTVLKK